MNVSRRKFLAAGLGAMALGASPRELREILTADDGDDPGRTNNSDHAIDRKALIDRHPPVLHKLDPLSPLPIDNGEFAFTADFTGLQTFPTEYENSMPLCTMSQWGWHTTHLPSSLDPKQFRLTQYDTHGRSVGYATSSEGQRALYDWLRENPHRLHLGQIGLLLSKGDETGSLADISAINQRLDLWAGTLRSDFKFAGEPISVRTAVHPNDDLLAVSLKSGLIREGRPARLAVRLRFPYGSPSMDAADWAKSKDHRSKLVRKSNDAVRLDRNLDNDKYHLAVEWIGEALFEEAEHHQFDLYPTGSMDTLAFVVAFAPRPIAGTLPTATQTSRLADGRN